MIRRRGFTLVELNLAIFFVAILVLGVAMTTIHITRIYQKGLTVRTINQIGRDVNGQLRRDISAARPSTIQIEPFVNSGRICLGSVSYVYNTAAGIAAADVITASDAPDGIFLVRADDPQRLWCAKDLSGSYQKNEFASGEQFTELLVNDAVPLAVHELAITEYAVASATDGVEQHLYHLTMQLGTNEAETTSGGKCLPPNESTANFDYCFIAEFETIIRAGEVRL